MAVSPVTYWPSTVITDIAGLNPVGKWTVCIVGTLCSGTGTRDYMCEHICVDVDVCIRSWRKTPAVWPTISCVQGCVGGIGWVLFLDSEIEFKLEAS